MRLNSLPLHGMSRCEGTSGNHGFTNVGGGGGLEILGPDLSVMSHKGDGTDMCQSRGAESPFCNMLGLERGFPAMSRKLICPRPQTVRAR